MKSHRNYIYVLFIIMMALMVGCSSDSPSPALPEEPVVEPAEPEEDVYKTYLYYSYGTENVLTADDFKSVLGEETFVPYTIGNVGDTLLIANDGGNSKYSVIVYSVSKKSVLGKISSFNHDGTELSFTSLVEAIYPYENMLFVLERNSKIHVFNLPDLSYLTCIGDGNWGGQVFQAQAMAVQGGIIYARDKNGEVSLYKVSDVSAANYQKINRWKKAAGIGTANNYFRSHAMAVMEDGKILLTDYNGLQIRVLDTSLAANLTTGESMDIADQKIATSFFPYSVTLTKPYLYCTASDGKFYIYSRDSKEWNSGLSSIAGYQFVSPYKVYAANDSSLFVSDKNSLVHIHIYANEIREYEK